MKCKHESINPYVWREGVTGWGWFLARVMEKPGAKRCLDCGAWLSLGESDEHASEQVEQEIRAAELATAWEPVGGVGHLITGDEVQGWNGWPYRQPTNDGEWIGFLAAQIRNHEQDIGDVNWAGHHMADHEVTP